MSTRRVNSKIRCDRCRLTPMWCICHKLQSGFSQINLTFITHFRERHLSSNTVNLVLQTLPENSHVTYYGEKDHPIEASRIFSQERMNYFLYPDEEAIPLDKLSIPRDQEVNLIVPDGTWTQAKKVKRRNSFLHEVQSVKLPENLELTSTYQLRQQTESTRFCTLEAVAYALAYLEKDESNKNLLLKNLEYFNHNTMLARNAHLLNYTNKY